MRIHDEFYLKNKGNSLQTSSSINNKQMKLGKSGALQNSLNTTMISETSSITGKAGAKNNTINSGKVNHHPVYLINKYKIHTLKSLFISIFEKKSVESNTENEKTKKTSNNKSTQQSNISNKNTEDINIMWDEIAGKLVC